MQDSDPPPLGDPASFEQRQKKLTGWNLFVANNRGTSGLLVTVAIAATILAIVFMWALLPEANSALGGTALGIAGIIGLIVVFFFLSLAGIGLIFMLAGGWLDTAFSSETEALKEARRRAQRAEDEILKELEGTDDAGLLQLQRYSRGHLEAYYAMGLQQARRSFVNATLAMWLGFLILLAGVALHSGSLEPWHVPRPTGDFNTIVLASAVIVEVIAALFLWVYRSAIGQLTFYYRLQMHSHTSILCYRMAETMASPDETRHLIIAHVLGASFTPERPDMTAATGLRGLLNRGG